MYYYGGYQGYGGYPMHLTGLVPFWDDSLIDRLAELVEIGEVAYARLALHKQQASTCVHNHINLVLGVALLVRKLNIHSHLTAMLPLR